MGIGMRLHDLFPAPDLSQCGKSARNERRKIRANYWNGLALTVMAIGSITPFVAAYLRAQTPTVGEVIVMGMLITVALPLSFMFHQFAMDEVSRIED